LRGLATGQWRSLTPRELSALQTHLSRSRGELQSSPRSPS
jgi:hypothetical protein